MARIETRDRGIGASNRIVISELISKQPKAVERTVKEVSTLIKYHLDLKA